MSVPSCDVDIDTWFPKAWIACRKRNPVGNPVHDDCTRTNRPAQPPLKFFCVAFRCCVPAGRWASDLSVTLRAASAATSLAVRLSSANAWGTTESITPTKAATLKAQRARFATTFETLDILSDKAFDQFSSKIIYSVCKELFETNQDITLPNILSMGQNTELVALWIIVMDTRQLTLKSGIFLLTSVKWFK